MLLFLGSWEMGEVSVYKLGKIGVNLLATKMGRRQPNWGSNS
jgi:hypothetical protein